MRLKFNEKKDVVHHDEQIWSGRHSIFTRLESFMDRIKAEFNALEKEVDQPCLVPVS